MKGKKEIQEKMADRGIVSSIEYIVKKIKEKKVGAYCIRLDSVERIVRKEEDSIQKPD